MPYSKAQNRATTKWVAQNYDKVHFTAPVQENMRHLTVSEKKTRVILQLHHILRITII